MKMITINGKKKYKLGNSLKRWQVMKQLMKKREEETASI